MKTNITSLVAAGAEVTTGLALLVVPSPVGRLLLGAELTGVFLPVARVAGIALIALGVGCLPACTALCGMLTYSALATLYLLYLGIRGEWVGSLLGRQSWGTQSLRSCSPAPGS
jgi:hypothetical protein